MMPVLGMRTKEGKSDRLLKDFLRKNPDSLRSLVFLNVEELNLANIPLSFFKKPIAQEPEPFLSLSESI